MWLCGARPLGGHLWIVVFTPDAARHGVFIFLVLLISTVIGCYYRYPVFCLMTFHSRSLPLGIGSWQQEIRACLAKTAEGATVPFLPLETVVSVSWNGRETVICKRQRNGALSFKDHGGSQDVTIVLGWLISLVFRFCHLSVFHLSLLSFGSCAVLLYGDIYLLTGP